MSEIEFVMAFLVIDQRAFQAEALRLKGQSTSEMKKEHHVVL